LAIIESRFLTQQFFENTDFILQIFNHALLVRFIQPATQITKIANGFIATEWQRHLRFAIVHGHCQTR
jgi:hypothetical protein